MKPTVNPAAPTSVYRYYDASGVLLYVGITSRATTRQREHNADKEWWPFVHRQTVKHFDTRLEAMAHERELIRSHRPPFNKQHNPDHETMRTLYLALGYGTSRPRTAYDHDISRRGRQLLTMLGHRLPLQRSEVEDGAVTYYTSKKHWALASSVVWRPGILLRVPQPLGVLSSIETVGEVRRMTFEWTRAGIKPPARVDLKLRATKAPMSVYAYEAVAA